MALIHLTGAVTGRGHETIDTPRGKTTCRHGGKTATCTPRRQASEEHTLMSDSSPQDRGSTLSLKPPSLWPSVTSARESCCAGDSRTWQLCLCHPAACEGLQVPEPVTWLVWHESCCRKDSPFLIYYPTGGIVESFRCYEYSWWADTCRPGQTSKICVFGSLKKQGILSSTGFLSHLPAGVGAFNKSPARCCRAAHWPLCEHP